jgi:hypothetical protein
MEQNQITCCLRLNSKVALVFSIVILSLFCQNSAISQELPKNLLYANENLIFEEFYRVGEYKILHFADEIRQNQRFMYLLNEANIVVDTMPVRGNDLLLMRSDSSFSIKNTSDLFEIYITEGKFKTKMAIDVSAVFISDYIRPYFIVNRYVIGTKNLKSENYLSSYFYFSADSLELLQLNSFRYGKYNTDDSTKIYALNEEDYRKLTGKTYEKLPIRPLFDKEKSLVERVGRNSYGSTRFSLHKNHYTFYDREAAKIFSIDMSSEPQLINEIELPIADKDKEGWKYLFDFKLKKHYAIKRINITEIPEGMKKRKADKIEETYEYQLHLLNPEAGSFKLKPLYKLTFDPVLIDNGLVYEIIQESKKGSAIFFHPLDPNYKYEKSTYLDY